ncbi:hypothetical protein ACFL4G_12025 [Thermodesulfobacteriota bacterium]
MLLDADVVNTGRERECNLVVGPGIDLVDLDFCELVRQGYVPASTFILESYDPFRV